MYKKLLPFLLYFPLSCFAQQGAGPATTNSKLPPLNFRGDGMQFTENKGQIIDTDGKLRPDILFRGEGGGTDVYLRKTGISYVVNNLKEVMHEVHEEVEELEEKGKIEPFTEHQKEFELLEKELVTLHRVDVNFIGCSAEPGILKAEELEGYTNYYYGHCSEGLTGVKTYNEVTAKDLYPGIDVKYYGGIAKGLKYDIIVNPGADPSRIQLKYSGAQQIELRNGRLKIKTSVGELGEYMPSVYQRINGKVIEVNAKYVLWREAAHAIVSFSFSTYDPSYPLIIDPWMSYFGGTLFEYGSAVATDQSGNVVFTGTTQSNNFPVSTGAFQTVFGTGGFDAYAVKMDPMGKRLWATYCGGSGQDKGLSITCDAAGDVIVCGSTMSSDFPVGFSGSNMVYQNTIGGVFTGDAFLIKLDPGGLRLWGTYYGGQNADLAASVATDGNNVFMYGYTGSLTAISTSGSYQASISGTIDLMLICFAPNGARIWGTYCGGSMGEYSTQIVYDKVSTDLYLCGVTYSLNFPTLAGHQMTQGGAQSDEFLCRFTTGGKMVWSTYYGGVFNEMIPSVAVDGQGNVILGGITQSTNNIASFGAYQTVKGAFSDDFVAKFSSNGVRQWGTYLGGSMLEWLGGLATDKNNNIYVLGEWEDTNSGNYPVSPCALQPQFAGGSEDLFIAKYDPSGKQKCITYLGGSGEDDLDYGGGGIVIYDNYLYLTSYSAGHCVTSGAFQTTLKGPGDAIIDQLCINLCEAKTLNLAFISSTNNVCPKVPITFTPSINNSCDTSGYKYLWAFQGGTPATSTALNPNVTWSSVGSYNVQLTVITPCKKDSLLKTSFIKIIPCGITALSTSASICKGSCASISATGSGGTSPYTYTWNTGQNTQTINPCPTVTTTYTVLVTDAGGATSTASSQVYVYQQGTASITSSSNVSCNGGNNGSASATMSGGTSPYTYTWSNGQSGSSVLNLGAGIHTVTVTDANGCTSQATVSIFQPGAVVLFSSFTNASCGGNNGSASASASGGAGGFSYTWSNGGATASISNLQAGTYTVQVKDVNGCTATALANIGNTNSGTASVVNVVNAKCYGSSTGSATASMSGGTGPYTYSWNNGASQAVNTNLSAGTYTVSITDANGCTANATVNISSQPALVLLPSQTIHTSCGLANGSIGAFAGGGISPYTYTWSNGATSSSISNIASNTYTITVTDNAGCTITGSAVVNPSVAANVVINPIHVSCFGGNNGSAMASVTSGTSPYTYAWSNGSTQSSINNLQSTIYTVTVTDANGCSSTATVNITQSSPINLQTSSIGTTCGQSNGFASVTTAGGTGTYTYTWSNGATTSSIINLPSNIYTVTVTDSNGCTQTASANVSNTNGGMASIVGTDVSCFGGNNGTATAIMTGGTGPYTYSWTNGPTTQQFNNLTIGQYTVTVTDANGCTSQATVTITQPSALGLQTSSINLNCFGANNGSASVTATGGTGAYTYSWANGPTTQQFNNLTIGQYIVTVTDANGCSSKATVTITQPPQLILVNGSSNVTCFGAKNGLASVTASGGTGAYTYNWSNTTATATATGLSGGAYTVTVTDSNGCTITQNFYITEPPALVLQTSFIGTTCGQSNGSASVTVAGGTGPYTYTWSNGTTQSSINNLQSSIFTVTVTDANGCSKTTTVAVTNTNGGTATATATAASCFGSANGTATATMTGGTGPYTYTWSNGATQSSINNLQSSIYTVTVTDANGCSSTATVNITQPSSINLQTSSININCFGANNGSALVTATGGTSPYTYTWSNGATTSSIINLPSNIYTVTITDANGCTASASISITQPSSIILQTSFIGTTCGQNNGSASVTASGGTGAHTYSWINGPSTQQFNNLAMGQYTVTITDAAGCTATSTVNVTGSSLPSAAFSVSDSVACGMLCVQFTASASGLSYAWSFGDGNTSTMQNPKHCFAQPGTYDVTLTITDNYGCTNYKTRKAIITVYPLPVADFSAAPQPTTIIDPVIHFTDLSVGAVSWLWSFGEGASSTLQNPVHVYKDTGCYKVLLIVQNQYSCADSIEKPVCVKGEYTFYAPNAFTPQGDGKNDFFFPKGIGVDPEHYQIWIFDRWGNLIWESTVWGKGWDGRANGGKDIAQQDIYVWKCTTQELETRKKHTYIGHVTLVR